MNKPYAWKKSRMAMAAALLSITLLGSGCGQSAKYGKAVEPQKAAPSKTEASTPPAGGQAHTSYPLKLKDATGVEVVFDKAPERIAALAPSETETLFALGAGDRVVGVDKWSDYPEAAKAKPKVGDLNTNLEALLAVKPDVIFASSGVNKQVIDKLRELKLNVYASEPKSMNEAISRVETFGVILDRQEAAARTAAGMRDDLKRVEEAIRNAPKKRVYMEFSPGWTVGDGEFMSEMLTLAGGVNVASGQKGWYQIDPEAIIKANPDVIMYSRDEAGMGSILEAMKARPGWNGMEAMKNNKLYPIEANLTNRIGPRVTKGLVEMAKAIHPELVK